MPAVLFTPLPLSAAPPSNWAEDDGYPFLIAKRRSAVFDTNHDWVIDVRGRVFSPLQLNVDGLVDHWQAAIDTAVARTCSRWRVKGADAEDLKAELWLYVLRDHNRVLRQFEGRSGIETYLYIVLKRAALKWIKRQRTRRAMEAAGDPLQRLCGSGTPPAEYLMAVRAALSKLPVRDRTLLQMWAEGYSFGEIAGRRGESAKAVQHRVYRAIACVRAELTGRPAARRAQCVPATRASNG